jgi:hypothetical protein
MTNLSHQGRSTRKTIATASAPKIVAMRKPLQASAIFSSAFGTLMRLPCRKAATPIVCKTNVLQILASV